jgi:hypothetical protein
VTTGGLTDFISALVRAIGEPLPAFDTSVVGSFAFDGGIEISPTRLAINDFKASLGGDSAAGTLALTQGKQPSLQGKLSLRQVDLDKWLKLLAQPGVFLPKATSPASPAAKPAAPTAAPAPPTKAAAPTASLSPFPPQLGVDLDLDIAETAFRKGMIRDLGLALQIRNGAITVPRLKATLPGEMLVQADAAVDAAGKGAGTFTLAGSKLRDTLAWLEIDASGVPQDKLQSLSVKGKVASTAGSVNVTDATLELDGQPAKGGGALTFGPPFTVSATLIADRFDLDAYMPTATATMPQAAADLPAAGPPVGPDKPAAAPDKSTPKLQLKSKIAKLIYRREDAERRGGQWHGAGQTAHRRRHQGRRPVGCEARPQGHRRRFRSPAALRSHLQRDHAGYREAARLRATAEVHQRQDRTLIGERQRGRYVRRAQPSQCHGNDAGLDGACHRRAQDRRCVQL